MIDQPGSQEESFEAVRSAAFERDVSKNTLDQQLETILAGDWRQRLATENYEEASRALAEVQALKVWRSATNRSTVREFYQLFEQASRLNAATLSEGEKQTLRSTLVDRLSEQADHLSPRAADLYQGLLAMIEGAEYHPTFPEVHKQLSELATSGDLADLVDPRTPIDIKLDRMQKRLEGPLEHFRAKDRSERRHQSSEDYVPQERPTTPPPASEESKPGMDEMERAKEGEIPPAIWTITPPRGGYFKEQSYDTWDPTTNTWRQSAYQYSEQGPPTFAALPSETFTITAPLPAGQWTRLPRPYAHDVLSTKTQLAAQYIELRRDQNGDYLVLNRQATDAVVSLDLASGAQTTESASPTGSLSFRSQFSQETTTKIQEIATKRPTNLARARALAKYTRQRLKYSNDSQYNAIYNADPRGYASAIDEHRHADCDVANTYFAALAAELQIPVRHVVGHMVKSKDTQGNSRITGGTGHAWSEVWDDSANVWERIDATPPGDRQIEEDRTGEAQPPGDYGTQEALGPTDAELTALEQQLAELKEALSYTSEERELAEQAGVKLEEARRIVGEIQAAENLRLPSGERILDVLMQLFSELIEERKTYHPTYTGPVSLLEGGEEFDDEGGVVTEHISQTAGRNHSQSRELPTERMQTAQHFGGLDVYMIGDKSGSMTETVDDDPKWHTQQLAETLIFSALHRTSEQIKKFGRPLQDPLSLRTQGLSFRGSGPSDLDLDKQLSATFSPLEKVKFWQSLARQGSGNGDVAALTLVRDQIVRERAAVTAAGQSDDRLRIILACSDGYPDNESGVRQLSAELGALGAVVVGIGMTETAARVPVIFHNPPHSYGDLARTIHDLPAIAAKHVIAQSIKLFPTKSRRSAQRTIDALIAKLSRIS